MIDLTAPLFSIEDKPAKLKHEAELRAIGAELAVLAARRGLDANFASFNDDRAIIRLWRDRSTISRQFDLRTLGQLDDPRPMIQLIIDRAADQLFQEKIP